MLTLTEMYKNIFFEAEIKPSEFCFDKTMCCQNLDYIFSNRNITSLSMDSGDRFVLKTAQSLPNCFVAGGAVLAIYTGEIFKIKDWDLYFKSESDLQKAHKIFLDAGFQETVKTDWATNMTQTGYGGREVVVQLVSQRYPQDIEDIFSKFDFSICCFAIEKDKMYYWKQSEEDVSKKVFNFNFTEQFYYCVTRIARYGEKGYRPTRQFAEDFINSVKKTKKSNLNKMSDKLPPS